MNSNTLNIKKVKYGNKAERFSFGKFNVPYTMPNLLDVQRESYQKFLNEDIWEVLNEFNPIIDYSNKAELSFWTILSILHQSILGTKASVVNLVILFL